jgi:hypothetical protein
MRIRSFVLAAGAAGLLATGFAGPATANDVKKFEGTIAAPAPVASNDLAADKANCPKGGSANGTVYRFFDLKGEFTHFYVSGPKLNVNQPDPAAGQGDIQDYDLDLYLFNAKCVPIDASGSINKLNGVGSATSKPARYAAVAYFAGPYPNIPVVLEASNQKIVKK